VRVSLAGQRKDKEVKIKAQTEPLKLRAVYSLNPRQERLWLVIPRITLK
jgi:hypothetical protein